MTGNICLPNNPPELEPIGDKEIDELNLLEFIVNAIDADLTDVLIYSVNNLPSGATFIGQLFSWTPNSQDSGTYDVEFVVDDGEDQDSETITITVNNVNHAPALDVIANQVIDEDISDSFVVSSSDLDFDSLVYSIIDEDVNEVDCSVSGTTVTMTPALNWNGDAICEVQVSDGDLTDSRVVNIEVISINDAPEFIGSFESIEINEDSCYELNLINFLGDGYFQDVDSDLDFDVAGNLNIPINIVDGVADICPEHNWFGERSIFFTATDGEYSDNSNGFTITVNDLGEPPEIDFINPITIDEDSGTNDDTTLTATDSDGTIDRYEISDENTGEVNCNIDEDVLELTPALNFNGDAECTVRVYDNDDMYDEQAVSITVNPVNDAPEIKTYSPTTNVILFEGETEAFSITASDVDGDNLETSWELDSVEVSTGNSYLFDSSVHGLGSFNLEAEVSDGDLTDSHSWTIFVGDIGDFTCEEVGGHVMEDNEQCPVNGELLATSDSDIVDCCSLTGEPAFSDTGRCSEINKNIAVNIKKPDDGDDFNIRDIIDVKVNVENNLKEKLDFDVYIYFYDLTDDDKIEDFDDSVNNLDKGEDETIETEFEIEEDLDEKNNYAIFVKVIDEDKLYCNEEYAEINIEREDNDVRIQNFKIEPTNAVCGDMVYAELEIKNLGNDDQDVYIVIENSELGIKEQGEEFELEEYDEDDEATKNMQFRIPNQAAEGEYDIKATAFFDNGDESFSLIRKLVLEECKEFEFTSSTGKVSLNSQLEESKAKKNNALIIYMLIGLTLILLIIYLFYALFK